MQCHGNGDSHCCWFNGEVCRFLEENTVPGRRWACGLYRKYGGWDAALASPEYIQHVQPKFTAIPALKGKNCRDWPQVYPETMSCQSGKCCYDGVR